MWVIDPVDYSAAVFESVQFGLAVCGSYAVVCSLALPARSRALDEARQDWAVVHGLDQPYSRPAISYPVSDYCYCSRSTAATLQGRALWDR